MAIEHVGRHVIFNDTVSNVESETASLVEVVFGRDTATGLIGYSIDGGVNWIWPTINMLSDVDTTGVIVNDFLKYNGTSWIPGQITNNSNLLIYDDGIFKATGTSISFNNNLSVTSTGTSVYVSSPITTYQRVAQPLPLTNITGTTWVVPDYVYASGSLAVFQNGLLLTPVLDFQEAVWVSGTYSLSNPYPTGTVFVTMYGVPCIPQAYIVTGTAPSANAIVDSNGDLILDSNGTQILDSNG